jgi:predicted MFS family arabinose efflux permease
MLELLQNRNLRNVLLIECLGAAVFMMFRTFMAPVAVDVLKLPLQVVSLMVTVQGTAAMCLLFCGSKLVGDRPPLVTCSAASLLVIVGNLFLAEASGAGLLGVGALIYGAGAGLLSYVSLSRLALVQGEKGKIAALFSLSVAIGNTAGPVAAGYAGERLGLQGAFLVPVLLMLALLGSVLWRTWVLQGEVTEFPSPSGRRCPERADEGSRNRG